MAPTGEQKKIAQHYLLRAIQNWGQPDGDRQEAKRAYLTAAGFDLPADDEIAEQWLADLLRHLPRGKFEVEVDFLAERLARCSGLRQPAA